MKNFTDISNNHYGRLTAIKRVENDKHNHAQWLCQCACGNEVVILKSSLVSGKTRSCGCYYKETRPSASKTHGQSKSRLFTIWANMHQRCENESNNSWVYYGAKGIKVCDDWRKFENFSKWAHENGYADSLTIDRISLNGDYEPLNCRWVDRITQMNNTTRNHFITACGETHTVAEWSRIKGISLSTLYYRISNGWDSADIVSTKRHIINNRSVTA